MGRKKESEIELGREGEGNKNGEREKDFERRGEKQVGRQRGRETKRNMERRDIWRIRKKETGEMDAEIWRGIGRDRWGEWSRRQLESKKERDRRGRQMG